MEIDPQSHQMDMIDSDSIHNIFKQIKMGKKEDISKAIEDYISVLSPAKLNLQTFSIYIMDLLAGYYRFLSANNIHTDLINTANEDLYSKLIQMDSIDELKNWIMSVSMSLHEAVLEQRSNKTSNIVHRALEYVEENYSNPELSIDLLCNVLGVSSSYFSTIFKKETGKTFINYLTEYRMKEAERLLIEEDEKKYIIAEKVGYTDPSYFSYVFKKWFGMSPVKYKNQRTNS